MTENDRLAPLPLANRLRVAAADLAVTGAPAPLIVACWRSAEALEPSSFPNPHRLTPQGHAADALGR